MLLIATQGNGPLPYVSFVYMLLLCPAMHRNIMKVCRASCHHDNLTSFSLKVLKNKTLTSISSLFFLGHLNFLAEFLHSIKLAELSDANSMDKKRIKNK